MIHGFLPKIWSFISHYYWISYIDFGKVPPSTASRCGVRLTGKNASAEAWLPPNRFWAFPGGKGSLLKCVLITRGLLFEILDRLPSTAGHLSTFLSMSIRVHPWL